MLEIFGIAALIAVCSGIGYLLIDTVSGGITAGYADGYSNYSEMGAWVNNALGIFPSWLSLFGVFTDGTEALVSSESFYTVVGIIGASALLIIPVILLFFYKKISSQAVKITLLAHFAVSAFIIFGCIFGRLGNANWRLTPMLATSVMVSFISALELIRQKKGMAIRFGVLMLALLLLLAGINFSSITNFENTKAKDTNIAWHLAADELEARGLKYGYANFWFSGVVTMLSDEKVQISSIQEHQYEPMPYEYQLQSGALQYRRFGLAILLQA